MGKFETANSKPKSPTKPARTSTNCRFIAQQVPQHHSVVTLFIARGVDQRDWPFVNSVAYLFQQLGVLAELGAIAAPEFRPTLGAVSEPLPQRRTRGNLFEPMIDCRARFLDAARPEPVDQDTGSITRLGGLIGTFQFDFGEGHFPGHLRTRRVLPAARLLIPG